MRQTICGHAKYQIIPMLPDATCGAFVSPKGASVPALDHSRRLDKGGDSWQASLLALGRGPVDDQPRSVDHEMG